MHVGTWILMLFFRRCLLGYRCPLCYQYRLPCWKSHSWKAKFSTTFLKSHFSKSQIFVQKFNFDKTPTFSRIFHPKKSTIFSGNQSWIFGQKMKVSNSVNHMHSDYRLCMQYVSSTQPRILTWHNFDDTKLSRHNFRLSHFLMLLLIFTRFIISRIVNHQEDQVVCVMFIFLNAGSSASTNFSTLFPGYLSLLFLRQDEYQVQTLLLL